MPRAAAGYGCSEGPSSAPSRLSGLHVRVFRAVRRRQTRLWLLWLLKDPHALHFVMMNEIIDAFAARGVCASRWIDEKGALCLKVRASMRPLSPMLDTMACSLVCLRGCPWLAGYPTLIVTFFDYQSRTTCQAASELTQPM